MKNTITTKDTFGKARSYMEGGYFMDELRKKVIEKLESDMIFCFECDEQEKAETYNQLLNLSVEEMLKYLED